ncbi:ribbon-helix-helix domain-containing protein [Leisingera methylohalidivorans]|uniref:Type II toxin-antitoxin system ParD family antitoxin n=1 Tax=Leisingera methylohalidivorans DSM 14336 TaxID=999552 RepID=V9W173_9RHOB|nr:type II toxin-antitoxin system ParD family antitoxin [Leisingera methylohalidivorans]AHD03415.1 hypothetical protein METH_21560 [Leisingera methylohalidivorans DSM 14336]
MSVKASISRSESQDAFARDLVAQGRFASVSAVMQQGLELLRAETEARAAETEALRALLKERRAGAFSDMDDARKSTRATLARKKAQHGL